MRDSTIPDCVDLTDKDVFPFWSQDRIRFADLDLNGHVNNIAFAVYCETGRVEFRESLTERSKPGAKVDFVVVRTAINFIAQGFYPGQIEVGTRVLKIGDSSCTLGQGVFCNGNCIGTGETVWVYADTEISKSLPIPDELRALIEPFQNARAD